MRLRNRLPSLLSSCVMALGLTASLTLAPSSAGFNDTTLSTGNVLATSTFYPTGLAHYWSFDGDADDIVASLDGTLNGATIVDGYNGEGLSFDETNDYVTIPDVTYAGGFTIVFNFNIADNTGALFKYIYSHGDVNLVNSINIFINEAGHGTDPNVIRAVVRDGNDSLDNLALQASVATMIDGKWHSYALVVDPTTGITTYLDGVLAVADPTRGTDGVNPADPVIFGGRDDLDPDRFFGGSLDGLQVYNQALSPAEVASLFP